VQPTFELSAYYPIFIYLVAVVGFAVTVIFLAQTIGPRRKTAVKQMPYESGMDPVGDARQRFDVKFYLIAIMFLVFDVELLFLYPWAVISYGAPPTEADQAAAFLAFKPYRFWGVLVFLVLLAVAYVYDWRKGVFKWR
jgi:NADH:ubiquinone oxidoreductase subunit 3 (subunit A)